MIKINNLNVALPGFLLSDINLNIRENNFFALLGPTGSGKTVLLEAIAGLIRARSGSIIINNKDITSLPPEKRDIGIVYQDCSLFPHLSVRENIRYGLRFNKTDTAVSEKRFSSLVDELNIGHLLQRKPEKLSGGEKQRTALARALITGPNVLLLDEPFSAIDRSFRSDLQQILKRLQKSSRVTFLMVTHSFSEALSLADCAAVLQEGMIRQQGAMMDIFKKPCSAFVADFVGMTNVFSANFHGSIADVNGLSFHMGASPESEYGYIAIRPEDIVLSKSHLDSSIRNSFVGTVQDIIDRGLTCEVHIVLKGVEFKSYITRGSLIDLNIHSGSDIFLSFKATAVHNF